MGKPPYTPPRRPGGSAPTDPARPSRSIVTSLDEAKISPEVMAEYLRQSELRVQAIFQASMGMDQRAAVLAAAFAAAAGALAAAAFAVLDRPISGPVMMGVGMLCVAAASCAIACRPQRSYVPGVDAGVWARDPESLQQPEHSFRLTLVGYNHRAAEENERRQAFSGRFLLGGMLMAAATPIVTAAVALTPSGSALAEMAAAGLAVGTAAGGLAMGTAAGGLRRARGWFRSPRTGAP